MSDPLPVVSRLRRLAVDEAKRAMADCLRAETLASQALSTLDAAIAAETDAASEPSGDDRNVEDFALWLRRIARDRAAAAAALHGAETRSAEARAVLAASRAAARAMEEMLAGREVLRQAAAEHREQAALDETGAQRHGGG